MSRLTREERKAETRARLIAAAAEVFARRGFQAASVDEVAQAAGFTKGAVYAHFDGKEDLFLAMLDERFGQRLREVREVVGDDRPPAQQARAAGAGFMAYVDADPRWAPLFFEFWAHAVRNPDVAGKLVRSYRSLRRAVAELIEQRARELGLQLPVPAEDVALMTFAMANGVAFERVLEPERVPAELYATMLEVFFRGLAALERDGVSA